MKRGGTRAADRARRRARVIGVDETAVRVKGEKLSSARQRTPRLVKSWGWTYSSSAIRTDSWSGLAIS